METGASADRLQSVQARPAIVSPTVLCRVNHQTALGRLCPWQHPHPPFLRQRDLLPSAPVGLQPDQLVQTLVFTRGVSDRHATDPAPQNPVDARPTAPNQQSPRVGLACERPKREDVEVCLGSDRTPQALTVAIFTRDSG